MKKIIFIFALLLFAISFSNAQWESDLRLTSDSYASNVSFSRQNVASSGNFVHVVWCDDRLETQNILYKRSTNAGLTWEAETILSTTLGGVQPCIVVSGQIVHIISVERPQTGYPWVLFYRRSADNGENWGERVQMSNHPVDITYIPVLPVSSIALSGSNVHIVWTSAYASPCIYHKCSADEGVTWGSETMVTQNFERFKSPKIAVSGQFLHLIFETGDHLYYKRSSDNGISWELSKVMDHYIYDLCWVSVTAYNQNVNIVWKKFQYYDIFYQKSTNNGDNWLTFPVSLVDNKAFRPSLAMNDQNLHMVFDALGQGSVMNRDERIFYRFSSNNGENWEDYFQLSEGTSISKIPSISLSGTDIHIVWEDYRDGNYEIYYKRNTPLPSAPILVSPVNGATNPTELDWNDVDFATSYNLEVATDVVFGDKVVQQTGITTSQFVLPYLISNKTYYWRVNAVNQAGTSPWSEIRSFIISPPQCNISVNAGEDEEIFIGYGSQSVELTVIASGGTEPYSYLWTPGGATTQSITVSPTATTTYSVQVTDNNQCTETDEVTVYVYSTTCGKNGDKVLVCHHGITICISPNAVPDHLAHGDYLGPCIEGPDNITNSKPAEYTLYENYPNPFNPVTRIKFDLPENTNVRLIIYDILGREVTVLADGFLQAGRYVIDWNASEFASGIYFYRIITNDYKETRKMFLMK